MRRFAAHYLILNQTEILFQTGISIADDQTDSTFSLLEELEATPFFNGVIFKSNQALTLDLILEKESHTETLFEALRPFLHATNAPLTHLYLLEQLDLIALKITPSSILTQLI